MALDEGDLGRAAKAVARDCYRHIMKWHKSDGDARYREMMEAHGHDELFIEARLRAYRGFRNCVPPVSRATEDDMDRIFDEVIAGQFEWAYHEAGQDGVKTAAYAHLGGKLLDSGVETALRDIPSFRRNLR